MNHYTKSLPYELELTSRVIHEAINCFFKENNLEISHDEFVILDCLYMNPNIIQIELAKMILKGRAHTGRFLMTLEDKGFVSRTPTKSGTKLIMKLSITDKGLKVYKKISQVIDEHIEKMHTNLDLEEIKILNKTLQKIRSDIFKIYDINFK